MNREKKLKKSKFNKFLKIYILILIIITIIAIIYVNSTLRKYEENQADNYMESVITNLKKYANDNEIGNHINSINVNKSEFESSDASVEKGLNELLKSDVNIKFEINANSNDGMKPIYDIYVDDYKIFEVGLEGTKTETRLSLLTFFNWKISYINVEAEEGLLKFEVSAPSNYEVYVNNIKLTENQILTSNLDTGLMEISKYVEIPYLINYKVDGLIEIPKLKIIDNNGNEINAQDMKIDDVIKEFATEDEAKAEISNYPNILKIAEDWSLFLSDDLSGKSHGFYNISEYLIKDSYLYNYAYKWVTNVDITLVSNHTLKNPTFTNETLSNFTIYNPNAFSCDVHLDKNMIISNGSDLIDSMNEKMYFAYYDDTNDNTDNPSWKLVSMQSLTSNKE